VAQNKSTHHVFVILNLPRPTAALLAYTQTVVTAMTNNPNFPTPSPALAVVAAAGTALQSAETTALTRVKGAAVVRNDKREALVTLLRQLQGYVQKTADADPENGAAIIQSAGMGVRKVPVRKPRVFSGKPGAVSGSIELTAPLAARRGAYEWQYSTDGGKSWIESAPSLRAATTITGLPVASSVQFRYRSVTKAGPSDWSAPIAVLVK
jgi:hypothetical protein